MFYCNIYCIGTNQPKQHLPLNLISTTNQQKVSQNLPIKQQIPFKLASRLSAGGAESPKPGAGGPQQILPLKLSQDEKIRRTSTSGYQRLSENSFSPPSEETVRINLIVNFHVFLIILILDAYNTFSHKNRLQPSHDAAIAAIVGRFQSVPKSQRCQSYSYQYLPEIPRKIQSARRTTAVPG